MSSQSSKTWDLEERVATPITRTPMHASPMRVRLGDYEVRTWGVEETISSNYHLTGRLSVSKITKKTEMRKKRLSRGKECFTTETTEWTSVVPAEGYDRQLYHPRAIAEVVVADLKSQGIIVNSKRTEELLIEALKPYVNSALHYCVDTKK